MEGGIKEDAQVDSSLDLSISSSSTLDRRQRAKLKLVTLTRTVFLAWRNYARQISRDKRLFFRIREFIIKRLQSKAFKSLKLHYVIS
jgi:hypothetical protein